MPALSNDPDRLVTCCFSVCFICVLCVYYASLLQELEGLLYENVPPDTKDSNGNSLLLLAAQQVGGRR